MAEKRDKEIEKDEASLSKAKLLFECVTERKHVRVFEDSASNLVYEEVGPPVVIIDGGESHVEGSGVCRHSVWEFVRGGDRITVETLGCTDGREPAGTIGFLGTVSADDESHEFCKRPPGDPERDSPESRGEKGSPPTGMSSHIAKVRARQSLLAALARDIVATNEDCVSFADTCELDEPITDPSGHCFVMVRYPSDDERRANEDMADGDRNPSPGDIVWRSAGYDGVFQTSDDMIIMPPEAMWKCESSDLDDPVRE